MIDRILKKLKGSKLAKNSLTIVMGDGVSAFIQLVCLSIMTKTLGLDKSGMIVIIQSYSELFFTVFSFQSYNAIVTFVTASIEKNDRDKAKLYLKQTFLQDIGAAVVAFAFAFICISPAAGFMGWNSEVKYYLTFYTLIIFISNKGSFIGVLRVFGKFSHVVTAGVIASFIKLAWFAYAAFAGLPFSYFISGEFVYVGINMILLLYFTFKALKENSLLDFLKVKLPLDKQYVYFNLYNNIVITADIPVTNLTAFVVNKYMGFGDVTIFKTIQKFGSLVQKIVFPVRDVLFPELSKLTARYNLGEIRRLKNKFFIYTNAFGFGVLIIMTATSPIWLGLFMPFTGKNVLIMVFYMIYVVFTSSCAIMHLLFMTFNLVKYNLPIIIISNGIYIASLYVMKEGMNLSRLIAMMFFQGFIVIASKYLIIKTKYKI